MDVVMLSRLQFAAATMFHFLFVPLTMGLSLLVAWMETRYVRTGDKMYLAMTHFWGKLFLISFALGVVTGLTLEFQFGTNWSRYSAYVGDIFGALLALEATMAFFLESTFIGIWIFGWKKLSSRVHAGVMWLIALGSILSAAWILVANSWMQHPVGFTLRNGRAELTDFFAVITQKFAILQFLHTIAAAYVVSAFFVMGISAWYLLRKQHVDFFKKSFNAALIMGLVSSLFVVVEGDMHAVDLAHVQPAKLAAMEAHWETRSRAPVHLFAWPDEDNERNTIEWGSIPGMLSFLAFHDLDAEVIGLKDIPKDERPPVLLPSFAFKIMVGLGVVFIGLTVWGWFRRNHLVDSPRYLKLMILTIPLPFVAIELGWVLAEVGRQPWIVYGLMKTSDAVSMISSSQVMTSLIGFLLVYSLLGGVGFYLIIRHVVKGPVEGIPEQ
jgi:cytochrome d ubiquinol oxidase subunit I